MAVSGNGLSGEIGKPNASLEGDMKKESLSLNGNIPGDLIFYAPERDLPAYDGPYEVTPTPEGQVLETAGMLMVDDTTIRAIPVYEVSNTAGGTTVYIGTEV